MSDPNAIHWLDVDEATILTVCKPGAEPVSAAHHSTEIGITADGRLLIEMRADADAPNKTQVALGPMTTMSFIRHLFEDGALVIRGGEIEFGRVKP